MCLMISANARSAAFGALAILSVLAARSSGGEQAQDQQGEQAVVHPGRSTATLLFLSDAERASLEIQALDGSSDAAFRLYLFHATRGPEDRKPQEEFHWATIAAENGHPSAQHSLARILFERAEEAKDGPLFRRACYWLKQSCSSKKGRQELGWGEELKYSGCQALWDTQKPGPHPK
jgi:TPR repeat protein